MFKKALSLTLLLSSMSLAQVSKTKIQPTKVDSPYFAAEGIRVGVFKPNYELKAKFREKTPTGSSSGSGKLDLDNQSVGLNVGYSSIPVRNIGYIVSANLVELVLIDNSVNTIRLDGNGTYAFNKNLYSRAGLNFTRFVSANAGNFEGKLGFQFGLGFLVTANFGFDLSYSQSNFDGKSKFGSSTVENEYSIQGVELGVSATF